ncbi:transport-related membrane protein, partial [human gut metagenome]
SGVSYPREGIPEWLYNLGKLLPSSHGVNGFIRIQTMGASLQEVFAEIKWLVILTVAYGGLACIGIHQAIRREQRHHDEEEAAKNRSRITETRERVPGFPHSGVRRSQQGSVFSQKASDPSQQDKTKPGKRTARNTIKPPDIECPAALYRIRSQLTGTESRRGTTRAGPHHSPTAGGRF